MKKITIAILLSIFVSSYSLAADTNVGIRLSYGNFDATGSTTGVDNLKVSHSDDVNIPYGSVFLERQLNFSNFGLGFGLDYMPFSAELDAKTGTATKATVDIKDQWTVYIQPTAKLDGGASVYAKLGYAYSKLDITGIASVQATTGSSDLKNTTTSISKTLEGPMVGIGFQKDFSNGYFMRGEVTYTNFDDVSATMSNSRKVTADSDLTSGHISIGRKF